MPIDKKTHTKTLESSARVILEHLQRTSAQFQESVWKVPEILQSQQHSCQNRWNLQNSEKCAWAITFSGRFKVILKRTDSLALLPLVGTYSFFLFLGNLLWDRLSSSQTVKLPSTKRRRHKQLHESPKLWTTSKSLLTENEVSKIKKLWARPYIKPEEISFFPSGFKWNSFLNNRLKWQVLL